VAHHSQVVEATWQGTLLAMSRGKRLQTYVRFEMKAQLMVDGILDPHIWGLKAP